MRNLVSAAALTLGVIAAGVHAGPVPVPAPQPRHLVARQQATNTSSSSPASTNLTAAAWSWTHGPKMREREGRMRCHSPSFVLKLNRTPSSYAQTESLWATVRSVSCILHIHRVLD